MIPIKSILFYVVLSSCCPQPTLLCPPPLSAPTCRILGNLGCQHPTSTRAVPGSQVLGRLQALLWELDHEEGWTPKNWCFCVVVLEKTLESPLDCKEIQPVHPKGNQPRIFIGRADAEAPILWPPDAKSWLVGKDPDVGGNWGQEEKRMTEDEMLGWHHWLSGHEFEQTPGDGEGQGSLACYSPWGCKESNTSLVTEQQQAKPLF